MNIQWNPRWRAFEKGISIYRYCCSKLTRIKKKKKGTVVPVPLLPVSIPPAQKVVVAIRYRYHTYWYRYRRAVKGQIRDFYAQFFKPFHIPNPLHHIRQTLNHFSSHMSKPEIKHPRQCFHFSDPDLPQFVALVW